MHDVNQVQKCITLEQVDHYCMLFLYDSDLCICVTVCNQWTMDKDPNAVA